jgi:hypothetical protein
MAQGQVNKEALFNEVKGSLFEYLVGAELSRIFGEELSFQKSIDQNYLSVLSQQDRMVRQFYPEMLGFLANASRECAKALAKSLKDSPTHVRLTGKFSNSQMHQEFHEADLVLMSAKGEVPVSLKLNKKNAFVNTKSGGIKSFFSTYFPSSEKDLQDSFNNFVDREYHRMAIDLHEFRGLEYAHNWNGWCARGFPELPGQLESTERAIVKAYYARIAREMHRIFSELYRNSLHDFKLALPHLMGFGKKDMLQVIFFHDFPLNQSPLIEIYQFTDLEEVIPQLLILPFGETASVDFSFGNWALQVRVKPMNKFTTTALKVNCSVKVKTLGI